MLEFTNLTRTSIDRRFFKKIAEVVLRGENKKEGDLSIVLVGKKRMKELNRKYRKQDRVTDVLSFSYKEGGPFVFPRKNLVKLGEVAICPEYIKEIFGKREFDFEQELARSAIHGILHILGYNHKTSGEMEKINKLEKKYLRLLSKQ